MSVQSGIEAIRRFQVMFKDLAELADALAEVSSLESLAEAHKSAAATAQGETEKAKAAKAKAEDAIKVAEMTAQAMLKAAGEAVEEAKRTAQGLRDEAERDAEKILEAAHDRVEAMELDKLAKDKELADLSAKIKEAQSSLDAVNAERAALLAKLG